MVLSIIFLEDKHKIVLHLSIFYEYQQFFQHCIWVIFKKMKTLCDIEGEISNWTN